MFANVNAGFVFGPLGCYNSAIVNTLATIACGASGPTSASTSIRRPPGAPSATEPDPAASRPKLLTNTGAESESEVLQPACARVDSIPEDAVAVSSLLAQQFGYFEDSQVNSLALFRKFSGSDAANPGNNDAPTIEDDVAREVRGHVEQIPERPIIDFLIQYFIGEVNCQVSHTADVEFTVLILRLCSYASQFLPSPTYTLDRIRGISLLDIKRSSDAVADALDRALTHNSDRGSLTRLQHLCLLGHTLQCDGNIQQSWEILGRAVRVAQGLGLDHSTRYGIQGGGQQVSDLQREMRRRTFCSLYVWDGTLARRLDRTPFLPNGNMTDSWQQASIPPILAAGAEGPAEHATKELDIFTERLCQAGLVDFCKSSRTVGRLRAENMDDYDILAAEQRHEQFWARFVAQLPPAFRVVEDPDTSQDRRLPKLELQRQQLHISVFEYICYNFRPCLLMQESELQGLPAYKRVLLASQRRCLAAAALCMLDSVKVLHSLLGGSHSRYVGLVFPAFEAAVTLASLMSCSDLRSYQHPGEEEAFLGYGHPASTTSNNNGTAGRDPLQAAIANLTWEACLEAAQEAQALLLMLADVSSIAEAGAQALARLLHKAVKAKKQQGSTAKTAPGALGAMSGAMNMPAEWTGMAASEDVGLFDFETMIATSSDEFYWAPLTTNISNG
ncbi:hypothetical protein PG990_002531 [Apiospora arundinis]